MTLSDLAPGTRFRYPESGKTAVLLSVSPGGARIIFDNSGRKVAFQVSNEEGRRVEFKTPGKPVTVSAGSHIIPLGPAEKETA